MTLAALRTRVRPVDAAAAEAARTRNASLAKPPGSLGQLEDVATQLAAVAGRCPPPALQRPALVVAAGDHGVHRQGVTPWPQALTRRIVDAVCAGAATSAVLAAQVGAEIVVLDVGVAEAPRVHPRLRDRAARRVTGDLMVEAAMTADEATAALRAGADVAEELVDAGADLLVTGEMGVANTTAAAALTAAYTGAGAGQVTGRGAGIDNATLAHKTTVVERALARHGRERDPLRILASLGGLEHAALAGVMLAGAARRVPVLLDGVSTAAAALAAVALCPAVRGYLLAGHRSCEPAATVALTHLALCPLLDLQLRLGEGTGALQAVPLVQSAARVLRDVATLGDV